MSVVDGFDLLSHHIDGKLVCLTPNDPECCIFRVHTQLRNINEKAYEPQLLAIGPYHRSKDGLRQMEEHKLRYLKLILQRGNESSVKRYIKAMRELEGRARRCYAEPISLTPDEFVEMMLLDGCFLIELFRKFATEDLRDECDPIFRLDWMQYSLVYDVLLFENQLPLFVLTKLMEMTQVPNLRDEYCILSFIHFSMSCIFVPQGGQTDESPQNIEHLLALAHKLVAPPNVQTDRGENVVEWKSIPSATKLQEAGVKFKKLEAVNLFVIKFNNGVMEIPPFKIEDQSESLFRNLIAYEQYSRCNRHNYVTEYMKFMDNLINSPKDVELLCRRGIIENLLGDDEAVSTMFNKLGDGVLVCNFYYAQIFRDVNKHCRRRQNVWMAKLRHNYFNSPWALTSVLAAAFLLMLASTQTIFSVLSYIVSKK